MSRWHLESADLASFDLRRVQVIKSCSGVVVNDQSLVVSWVSLLGPDSESRMYESMVSHNERLSESPFDTTIHHMTAYPSDPKEIEKVLELRKLLESSNCQSYQQNLKWCNELQLVRFLIARKYDVKQAYDLLMSALKWRCERRPDEVEQCVGWSERFSKESETGEQCERKTGSRTYT